MNRNFCRALLLGLTLTVAATPLRAEQMYATNGGSITVFDSNNPSSLFSSTFQGLQTGETIVGIDLRPANGMLYGVSNQSRLYIINPGNGQLTQVGANGAFTLTGTAFGTDFNPVPDRLRQVSNTEQNLRINPNDGTAIVDTPLTPAGNIVAVAYSNNFVGAASTVLYAIDSIAGTLNVISNPNGGGPINLVGSLGLGTNLDERIGFDISGLSGTAYASIIVGGFTNLYTINLSTGAATLVGNIGGSGNNFVGLTAATAVPEPSTYMLLAAGALVVFGAKRLRARRVA
jgi:hypothetical protein